MKKVSTVAAKPSKKMSQQKLNVGLDLGDRNSWYCVLDETGRMVMEQKVSTTPKALQVALGGMPRSRMALEIGMHSPWISRLLSELEYEVIVANARKVRLIGESRKKDDRMDAQTLARLAGWRGRWPGIIERAMDRAPAQWSYQGAEPARGGNEVQRLPPFSERFHIIGHGDEFDVDAFMATSSLRPDYVWRRGPSGTSGIELFLGDGRQIRLIDQEDAAVTYLDTYKEELKALACFPG
jgi:hypothetical protein